MKIFRFTICLFFLKPISTFANDIIDHETRPFSIKSQMYEAFASTKQYAASIFERTERPTWSTVGIKLSASLAGIVGTNELINAGLEQESPWMNHAGSLGFIFSAGLLQDAVNDSLYLIYDFLRRPGLQKQAFKGAKFPSARTIAVYDELREASDYQIARVVRLGSVLFNIASIGSMTYTVGQNLIDIIGRQILGAKSLSSGNLVSCTAGNLYCFPVIESIFFGIGIATIVYDLRELASLYQVPLIQKSDSPYMSIIHGFAKASLSVRISRNHQVDIRLQHYLAYKDPEAYQRYMRAHNFPIADRAFQFLFRSQANYQIYSSVLMILKNGVEYFVCRPQLQMLEENILPSPPSLQRKRFHKKTFNQEAAPRGEAGQTIDFLPSPKQEETVILPKTKVKRRGIPNLTNDIRSRLPIFQTPKESISQRDQVRREALETIKEYRRVYPIKVSKIEKEVKKLKDFLNANLEGATGSVVRLIWHINGKRFALTFETPHEKDRNNYTGNKLQRILNTLEVGYLVGWDEAKILTYLEQEARFDLRRFPKFTRFLFGNRI